MAFPPPRFGFQQYHPMATFMPTYSGQISMVPMGVPGSPYSMVAVSAPMLTTPGARPIQRKPEMQKQPPTTAFVGNITDKASNDLIKLTLEKCGTVNNWKRIQGADGKLQAFGFCEFDHPEATLRAIRILHDWQLGEKKLVVKVDEKTRKTLNEYENLKRRSKGQPLVDVNGDIPQPDDETLQMDARCKQDIERMIGAQAKDLLKTAANTMEEGEIPSGSNVEVLKKGMLANNEEIAHEKRKYIEREINFFRESYKGDESIKRPKRVRKDDREGSVDSRKRGRSSSSERSQSRPSVERPISRTDLQSASRRSRSISPEDDDDEARERKRIERRLREKEALYQERLRKWESRERKRTREYEKEEEKLRQKRKEEQREAQKLREFLEDYDDERDDSKYYRGSAVTTRRHEFEKEKEADLRDRQREKEELEQIRKDLSEKGVTNPDAEIARMQKREKHLLKKRLHGSDISSSSSGGEEEEEAEPDSSGVLDSEFRPMEAGGGPIKIGFQGLKLGTTGGGAKETKPTITQSASAASLPKTQVFDDEEDEDEQRRRERMPRKLIPIEYTEEEKKAIQQPLYYPIAPEEKKRRIKELIEHIPTTKDELFAFPLKWDMLDDTLVEKRLKPWISKKIIEYIGEEEASLVDFVCQKVVKHCKPEDILNDVAMILDEEAEVFVVKMWRLLIYELEAKKEGLVKTDD